MTLPRLVLSACAAAFAAFAAISAAKAAAPSFVKGGSVTLCTDPTYAPMEFFLHAGDKAPVGFDIDLARALAKRWGRSFGLSPWPSPACCPASPPAAATSS